MRKRMMAVAAVAGLVAAGPVVAPGAAASSAVCTDRTFSVGERTFGKYVPPWTGVGDKDFHGHGPRVQVWGRLRYNPGRTALVFWITMRAKETKSDWTAVDGTRSYAFYTVPSGYVIQSVTDPIGRTLALVDYSRIYVDDDHSDDVLGPAVALSVVESYRVTGDTDGNEAGTRSGVTTTTRTMQIHARRCTST